MSEATTRRHAMPAAIRQTAEAIQVQRYAEATTVFVAGSLTRGEGTAFSDLDLVVVYDRVPHAYRESFRCEPYPVEAFVHDAETLDYFYEEVDRRAGIPALPRMVSEGIPLSGETSTSAALQLRARQVLALGPAPLTPRELCSLRYRVTDLLDDIRAPRFREGLMASGASLFELLADGHLRSRGRWSAKGKALPRALHEADPELCARYCRSFDQLFTRRAPEAVIALAEELLAPLGGLLFEGHRVDAPPEWRTAAPVASAPLVPGLRRDAARG